MILYKFTGLSGEPRGWQAGEWTPKRVPELCVSGWHLSPVEGLSSPVEVGMLWEAEGRGEAVGDGTKTAFASARLLRPVGQITHPLLVLAACDWAEHTQPDPVPDVSARALAAGRAWAECPCEEHRKAVADAAAYSASPAVYSAASAVYYGASAATSAAYYAASAAASAAAYATAARAARSADANDAERRWQGEQLIELVRAS